MRVLKAVEEVNDNQKEILFRKLQYYFNGEINGLNIAVWGLSFKPGTNDMRDAPSINLIHKLLDHQVNVSVYDPAAIEEAKSHFGNKVEYATDIYDAANNADAVIFGDGVERV